MSVDYSNIRPRTAEELFDMIPIGNKNKLYVDNSNRKFRTMVKEANLSGEDVIINISGGYFKVDPNNEEDMLMFNEYIEREQGRAREMWIKANAMKRTMNERRSEYGREEINI